jgi:BirA family biotin operon repressor/biotin-[acetyl-CoA-carboxylase] ligase
MTEDELPVPEATSLLVAGDEVPDRTDLLLALLASLWESYSAWQEGGDLAAMRLSESYVAACATIGSRVRVQLPSDRALAGTATGIDADGRLLVEHSEAGRVETTAVSAGDVVHVRAAE